MGPGRDRALFVSGRAFFHRSAQHPRQSCQHRIWAQGFPDFPQRMQSHGLTWQTCILEISMVWFSLPLLSLPGSYCIVIFTGCFRVGDTSFHADVFCLFLQNRPINFINSSKISPVSTKIIYFLTIETIRYITSNIQYIVMHLSMLKNQTLGGFSNNAPAHKRKSD